MKIFVTFDLEGVTGIVLEPEQTSREQLLFQQSRMLSTGDINAVAKGAVKAGVDVQCIGMILEGVVYLLK